MKRPNIQHFPSILFLLLGVLLVSTNACFNKQEKKPEKVDIEFEEGERIPNDWQYRQRAFPSGKIDHQAYFDALTYRKKKSLEQQALNRDVDEWEFCGPTNVGGRVTDIEMTTGTPQSIFVGSASGGIFRSNNSGNTWDAIFDDQPNLSIGDLAIAPSNENVIYVGTGEANAGGGSLAYDGNGIYKSEDAGDTWTHLGLENIGSVGKVVIDATDPNTCFVGAMGYLFENNSERGVYRTTDGGLSWQNVLSVNDSTGVIDLAIHPTQPNIIYAATWERVRRVNRRSYGGPSSGIYQSTDGGDTWQELTNGLPSSAGRIGIAIAESEPNILYAIYTDDITSHIEGLYKTTDGGTNWIPVNASSLYSVPYMWWFGKIFVDPTDADVLYHAGFLVQKSTNGGNSWDFAFADVHVDQHSICVNPLNPDMVLAGNDGGVYLSQNGGASEMKLNNLPITQFYTCEIDYSAPERLYGGTQDNGTIRTFFGANNGWSEIYGGDGFRAIVDPSDNSYVYAEYQYGNFARSTNGGSSFNEALNGINSGDRNNWNTPVVLDPNNPSILYFGTNRLYKSTNRALSWSAISPDLTQNLPQNNLTYGTITTISVSPVNDQIIYVGTDDGQVQVTINGGTTWENVSSALPERWATSVVADPDEENTAYVTFSGYRFGTNTGHIYKTTDLGANWVDVSGDLPDIPINDLIKRPSSNTIYLATDVGVFYSENEGANWELFGIELPNVVITDLDYHPTENMLVAASYGRGMYKVNLEELTSTSSIDTKVVEAKSFPNPFTEQTTIALSIEKKAVYTISIFNATGTLIQTIHNNSLDEGEHKFSVKLNDFPSGMYWCKIITQDKRIQQELKLVKL